MTTPPDPPAGPPPEDPQGAPPGYPGYVPPPPGYGPPPGYPPGYGPGYGPPPGYGYPPPGQPPRRKISIAMVLVGPILYGFINIVVALGLIISGSAANIGRHGSVVLFGAGALTLAAIAFGGGAVLLSTKSPEKRGLGLGLMIGWALVSVFSAGFCTGVNPTMYS